jgi:predicted DCC family thiol-disulfide oxidoreductase YuxK
MKESPRIHIYYDKNCPMCSAFADKVSTSDSEQILIDANTATDSPYKKENLLNEIHLINSDGKLHVGADAILTSLARIYPWLTPLAKIVRLPVFNWFATKAYYFISNRRTLLFGARKSRVYWLYIISNLGLLLGILLSLPLWGSSRTYPLIPIFNGIHLSSTPTTILAIALITSLFVSIFLKQKFRLFSLISSILLISLVFVDITRLQPWVWHYLGLLLLLSFWNVNSSTRTQNILDAARFVVVGIYFWSGLQKINTAFFTEVFPWFTQPIWSHFGQFGFGVMFIIGIFIPFIESAFALGLLTKRFRKISIIGSTLMLILVTISIMIGHGWNTVVWPWNFAIFLMVNILFLGNKDTFLDLFNRTKNNILGLLAITLFIIMPAGNIFDKADNYLSWSLYSGHVPTATIQISANTLKKIAPEARYTQNPDGSANLDFVQWSIKTFNTPPYPEIWVFENIFSKICKDYNKDPFLLLTIKKRSFFMSNNYETLQYTCRKE